MASEGNFLQRLVHLKLLEPTTDVKIDLQQFEKQSFLAVMSFSNMRVHVELFLPTWTDLFLRTYLNWPELKPNNY